MKILLWADSHFDVRNLTASTRSVAHLTRAAKQHRVDRIYHLGDVKDSIGPNVQGQVLNFTRETFRDLAALAKLDVLKGNHDAYGTAPGTPDWCGTLASFGATVYTQPSCEEVNGWLFVHIPYQDQTQLAEARKFLKVNAGPRSIAFFHQSVVGARLNAMRLEEGKHSFTFDDFEGYAAAFGGHFHGQQQFKRNKWFVGSPFPHSWGEANTVKGFLLLELSSSGVKVTPIASEEPGWYDPRWPSCPANIPKGSRVRVTLEPGEAPPASMEGFDIVLQEKPVTGSNAVGVATDTPDAVMVADALPNDLKAQELVLEALGSGARSQVSMQFKAFRGENFLSFEKLDITYKPGVHGVFAQNTDRSNVHSSGSGKTSYMQAPLLAFTGTNLKKQKATSWKRRSAPASAPCNVAFDFETEDGTAYTITRDRKGAKAVLTQGGTVISSGDRETVAMIEALTGMTAEVAASALFVDQRDVSTLLVGTDAERKTLLNTFLNLSRFNKAQDTLKVKARKMRDDLQAARQDISNMRIREEMLRTQYREAKELASADQAAIVRERTELESNLPAVQAKRKELEKSALALKDAWMHLETAVNTANAHLSTVAAELRLVTEERSKLDRPIAKTCQLCGNPIKDAAKAQALRDAEIERTANKLRDLTIQYEDAAFKLTQAKQATVPHRSKLDNLETERQTLLMEVSRLDQQYKDLDRRTQAHADAVRRMEIIRSQGKALMADISSKGVDIKALESLQTSFDAALALVDRNGLPLRIVETLCPLLNRSARYYSGLLADGLIGVQFSINDETLDVEVLNETGGESINSQSAGELRVLALIVTLALRELIQCNVLFLDEPTLGLDAATSDMFARALPEILERFPTVFIATHDPRLLEGLTDYERISIVKRNGVSRVTCEAQEASGNESSAPTTPKQGLARRKATAPKPEAARLPSPNPKNSTKVRTT